MFQTFAIALGHVKAENISKNLVSKISQIIIFIVLGKRNY